jgi:hypothetical protein
MVMRGGLQLKDAREMPVCELLELQKSIKKIHEK